MPGNAPSPIAVLYSGGLDSAILVSELSRSRPVQPIYIRSRLRWEEIERRWAGRFLEALGAKYALAARDVRAEHGQASGVAEELRRVLPLVELEVTFDDVYGRHWSTTGDVPDAASPDEAVYLPGRNLLLATKPAVWCHLHGIGELALGPLQSNPFPDATPAFFDGLSAIVNRAVGGSQDRGSIRIVAPFLEYHKQEVMRLGCGLPLELTFSCIDPVGELHCGRCNKCAERKNAFAAAEISDRTQYAA